MKSYFTYSLIFHISFTTILVATATLLSKPRMSYYSVDLFSMPAGSPSGGGGAAPAVTAPPPAEKHPLPPVPQSEDVKPIPKTDAIKVRDKDKRQPLPPNKPVPRAAPKSEAPTKKTFQKPSWATLGEGSGSDSGAGAGPVGIPGGSGAGIVAEAGPSFPYPWYLKAIADKLDKHWRPPQEFQADTTCQVAFTISRSGQVSDSALEKKSGDTFFDQLAMRAVLYANPLPPLPEGYPDDTLRVHMKFVGKRL